MTKKKIFIALAVMLVFLIVAVAAAVVIKNKFMKKPIKEEIKKSEPIVSKGSDKPVIPPKPGANIPPAPIDINKLQPPKKVEIPSPPPKLPELPSSVPTHIDIESLRAPTPKAPPPTANQ